MWMWLWLWTRQWQSNAFDGRVRKQLYMVERWGNVWAMCASAVALTFAILTLTHKIELRFALAN